MRLIGTQTSPYVRKVRVVAAELGVTDRLGFETVVMADETAALDVNPLRKVPTLVTDEGVAIYDSPVIVEWLDAELGGNRLLPTKGAERWIALTASAAADGILDAGSLLRTERGRPEGTQNGGAIQRQAGKIARVLASLEADSAWRKRAEPDLGQLAVGVAVAWLHFRLPEFAPKATDYPGLVAWFETFNTRPSMVSTDPS